MYRPGYPPELFDTILEELKRTRGANSLELAVDVATGSGQAAIPLAEHIPRVIGLDISQSQLDNAVQHVMMRAIHALEWVARNRSTDPSEVDCVCPRLLLFSGESDVHLRACT